MTPLPKHLEEMRDEKIEQIISERLNNTADKMLARIMLSECFNQAASILLKDMESMAKALESQRCELLQSYKVSSKDHDCKRCEELKNYREKYGDVK